MPEKVYRVVVSKPGIVTLVDGSKLILRVVIVGVKYTGFSPLGGVNFAIKPAGGVSSLYVPEELRNMVRDKPVSPPDRLPENGWELVDIAGQEPAEEEVELDVNNRKYRVKVIGEASMVSRNTSYKTQLGEPLYWVQWSVKVQWRPLER